MSALRRVSVVLALGLVAASLLLTSCAPALPTLQGQLTDLLTGLNLANVEVAAYSDGSQTLAALTVSDSSGEYSFARARSRRLVPPALLRHGLVAGCQQLGRGHHRGAAVRCHHDHQRGPRPGTRLISGTVLDGSVAPAVPLPGASAAAVSTVTGSTVATVATDAAGSYQLPNLPVGTYRVRFSAAGDAVRFNGSANAPSAAPIVAVTADTVSTGVGATMQPARPSADGSRTDVIRSRPGSPPTTPRAATRSPACRPGPRRFTLAGLNSTGSTSWSPTRPARCAPRRGARRRPIPRPAPRSPRSGRHADAGTQAMTGKDCDCACSTGSATPGSTSQRQPHRLRPVGRGARGSRPARRKRAVRQPVGLGPDERDLAGVSRRARLDRHHPRRRGPRACP